jgi:flagellar motility protein MotE (MotC chaperone)
MQRNDWRAGQRVARLGLTLMLAAAAFGMPAFAKPPQEHPSEPPAATPAAAPMLAAASPATEGAGDTGPAPISASAPALAPPPAPAAVAAPAPVPAPTAVAAPPPAPVPTPATPAPAPTATAATAPAPAPASTTSAAPENTETQASDFVTGEPADNAQKYCANIADAAADARFARQAAAIADLEKQIDERIKALDAARAGYEDWLTRREDFLRKADESVVAIFTQMRPDAASQQMSVMDLEAAAAILVKLNPRIASAILNEMDPMKAAQLTTTMAGLAKSTDQAAQPTDNAGKPG